MLKLQKFLRKIAKEKINEKSWAEGVIQCQDSRWKIQAEKSLEDLNRFIINERQCGNLSRQELVSMIPVFLLDIQPHHRVLDMCASPGSKSKHVLEIMHEKLNAVRFNVINF